MEIDVNSNIHHNISPKDKKQNGQTKEIHHKEIKLDSHLEKITEHKEEALKTNAELSKMMEKLQSTMEPYSKRFEFRLDRDINRIVIKVIDKKTDEIIKEIPPAEIQHLIASIRETLGLLVDKEI